MNEPTDRRVVMTEAELLAATDDEYMSRAQLDFFRNLLLQHRRELMQGAEATLHDLREPATFADEADRASAEEEYTLQLRIRDRERKLLRKVDQALARIDQGTYGWCEETSEPIGLRRLLARPTATLSVDGQERKEARARHYQD